MDVLETLYIFSDERKQGNKSIALVFLCKRENCIDMPPGFMDDLEGEVIYEKLYECGCVSLFCFPDRRGSISFSAKKSGGGANFSCEKPVCVL